MIQQRVCGKRRRMPKDPHVYSIRDNFSLNIATFVNDHRKKKKNIVKYRCSTHMLLFLDF